MKRLITVTICLFASGFLFAQGVDATKMSADTAQQNLKEVSIDRFEHDGFWRANMSSDQGIATARLFEGGPAGKQPIEDEEGLEISDRYVLATRVDFYHRGPASFKVVAVNPIPVEGITKTISVWAAGRNFNHELKIIVQDYFGRQYHLSMGKLNFQGWQQLTVAVPAQGDDNGIDGIVQESYHYNYDKGVKIVGFEVVCDPLETYGTYYLYLDDLRVVTDLFAENNRDEDDMPDGW